MGFHILTAYIIKEANGTYVEILAPENSKLGECCEARSPISDWKQRIKNLDKFIPNWREIQHVG